MLGTIVRALPVVLLLGGALPAQAQLTKRIGEAAKERITERKQRTKDHVVQRATEPVDSAVERVAAPIDSLAGQVGGGAAGAVSRLGREDAAAREAEELRLVEALSTVGRAELTGIAFAPGSDRLQEDGGPGFAALVNVLAANPGAYLIEGWAPPTEGGGRPSLGERRAAELKSSLVARGIPPGQLFAAAARGPLPQGAQLAIVRMQ